MRGYLVCEVIPYKNFKEKIRITKEYSNYNIEIYSNYVLVTVKRGYKEGRNVFSICS